ncbi:mechanosensitive ion channel domain-containing protein [uncultured Endozoicomonas sp.]|uniref:mechanosensitive ion channel family protein n=1 Tax=uncultured Endozoicomonas sp. TaxID=432652 RepID=UPI002601FC61|nr:mechanosensitive ion channel domain-containing protein [uncultured Endozoicomonas sp.]
MSDGFLSFYYHIIFAFLLSAIFFYGFRRVSISLQNDSHENFRTIVIKTVKLPLLLLPWFLFLFYTAYAWPGDKSDEYLNVLDLVRRVFWILYVGWFSWEVSLNVGAMLQASSGRLAEQVSHSVVSRTIQLLATIGIFLNLVHVFGYSLSTLLAFGGVGGIILGLAAKDWLSNFFGGLMLMLDRPFSEGDWIRSPDRSIEGHVEKVGWRLTKIRTFDRRPIYVPNSIFSGIVVENPSRMRNRRMVEDFSLCYENLEKMPRILKRIDETVSLLSDVDATEPHYAVFIRYDDSGLLCQIRAHITRVDRVGYLQVQEEILLIIADIVKEEGAAFAYPTRRIINE